MFLNLSSCRNINFIHKLRNIYQALTKQDKCRNSVFCKSFHTSTFNYSFKLKNVRNRNSCITTINTNVQNNVILYKNVKPGDLLLLKMFFYGWLLFNGFSLYVNYDPKYIRTWFKDVSWIQYIRMNGTDLIYFTYSLTIGPAVTVLLYVLNRKYVKYIILHKGGNNISIITNHICKSLNTITVPVSKVKTNALRSSNKVYLPIKIQGYKFYYLLDNQGQFLNRELFDYTVGTAKAW